MGGRYCFTYGSWGKPPQGGSGNSKYRCFEERLIGLFVEQQGGRSLGSGMNQAGGVGIAAGVSLLVVLSMDLITYLCMLTYVYICVHQLTHACVF